MSEFALLCQLVVGGVLGVSGISKLLDLGGTRDAAEALGVPERYSPAVAVLLPVVELATCLALVGAPGRPAGPVAAMLLLAGFTAVVLENLRRGRHPECHCFGRVGSSDISARTVTRNLLLILAAGVAFLTPIDGWDGFAARHSSAELAVLLLASALATAGVVLGEAQAGRRGVAARRQIEEQHFAEELEWGPAPRGPAPEFALSTITGVPVALSDLLDGRRPILLTFLSPGCGPCKRLRPVVQRWGRSFQDRLQVVVVTSGSTAGARTSFGSSELIVLCDEDREVAVAYDVRTRPSAVVVGAEGELLGPLAAGEDSIRRLVGILLDQQHAHDTPPVAPDDITLVSSPGPRVTVTSQADEDDVLVVTDEVTGASLALDRIGALVWQCLDGRSPLHEIVHDIAEGFATPPEVVAQDVLSLVRQLGRIGLLEGVAPDLDLVLDADHPHEEHPEPVAVS